MKLLIVFLTMFSFAQVSVATDKGKEQRWAEQVEANLFDGEMVWIDSEDGQFLGILMENESPKGYVVLAHGTGVHPDWEQVINPLRVGLAELGWTTLSIQMPVLPNEVDHDEYAPVFPEAPARFEAAAAMFAGKKPLVLIGHSLGSAMSTYYMKGKPDHPYTAFIGIGMSGSSSSHISYDEADNTESLKAVTIPVFDLYGSDDLDTVMASVPDRAVSQSHNPNYTQLEVSEADHFFNDMNDELISTVSDWLDKTLGAK